MVFWSFLWTAAQYLGLLIFGIVFLYAARDLICYMNLEHFRKQGVKCIYVPVIGIIQFFTAEPGQLDDLSKFKRFLDENKDEPLVMFNSYRRMKPIGFLLDDGLIREFLVKETEHTIKVPFLKNINFGFFFHNGDDILEARATYSDFFNLDNLEAITTILSSKVQNKMIEFGRKYIQEGQEYQKLTIQQMAVNIFCEVVNSILFAQDEPQQFNGVPLSKAIQEHIVEAFGINKKFENILSLDILHEFKLHPHTRQTMKTGNSLEDLCWNLYQKRLAEGPKKNPNLLDMLVRLNKKRQEAGKPPLTKYEIAGHFNVLQFAGIDTSMQTSTAFIYFMANNPSLHKDFQGLADQIWQSKSPSRLLTLDELNANERFEDYISETFRLFAPFAVLSPREFIKPCTIGKYFFRPGDRLHLPSGLMHTWSRYFDNPNEFVPERMSKSNRSNIKRGSYCPFGNGRRICVGKSLGEIMVKLVTLSFFKYFEVVKDEEYVPRKTIVIGYNYLDPKVLVRWRDGKAPLL
jgi:cytochrome P450